MDTSTAKQTKMGRALFWTSCLGEPLSTLYGIIGFILYKDLGATAFQIALMTCCKPLITILSFYWSAGLGRNGKVKSNVLWAGFLMRAPFLICPWVDSVWFMIGAAVNYTFFYRAGIPGWMEMIRQSVHVSARSRWFSMSSALGYVEGVVLALGVGSLLDQDPGLWRVLFFGAALIGLVVLGIQASIPMEKGEKVKEDRVGLKELLVRPWKDSYELMRKRPDFATYQWGFMLCGFGAMLIQPALPMFAVDDLGASYTEMMAGISIAKGLGFALSSPIWSRWVERMHVLRVAGGVFVLVALFPALLACSMWGIIWFYLAYFCYGIGQGGSHLIWNMGGTFFAGKEESSRYTGVGLAMLGLRGAIAPPLGGWLAVFLGPVEVLLTGGMFCLYSGVRLFRSRYAQEEIVSQKL